MKNKGKPSRQQADERKELDVSDSRAARTIHRFDRSRGDERGPSVPRRTFETEESVRQRRATSPRQTPARADAAAAKQARGVARLQGTYFLATGLWPIVHLRSFERVVGPKVDTWLVKTFGALVSAVGATLLASSFERRPSRQAAILGVGSALAIGAAETIYVSKGKISPVYLVDAAVELALSAGWLAVRSGSSDTG
jgi:hypothetical protein